MSTRKEYTEALKSKLDEWNQKIDDLEAKGEEVDADMRAQYRKQIQELKRRRDETEQKLNQLQDAGDEAWEDLKDGADEAWDALESALDRAKSRFT